MSEKSDVELMLAVRDGDKEAFRSLIERHQMAVINIIYRQIGDRMEAEDLAQNVFINIYHSASRYTPTAKFTTWLYTVVRNTCLNEIRRRQRHKIDSLDAMQDPDNDAPARNFPDTRARDAADQTQENELESRIRAAIQALPEIQRTAIVLLRYEDQSYEEIAKVIGCSVGATKSVIHRAREKLKEDLLPYLKGK